jgi:hypothetical protein
MSSVSYFRWDTPGKPYAGSVPNYHEIAGPMRGLRDLPAAEAWAAKALLKPKLSGRRREAIEHLLYMLLCRPAEATALVDDEDYDGDDPEPSLLRRSEEVTRRYRKLSQAERVRENLLLEFEGRLRHSAEDPDRNDKLAILCELLLEHPAAETGKPSPAHN